MLPGMDLELGGTRRVRSCESLSSEGYILG